MRIFTLLLSLLLVYLVLNNSVVVNGQNSKADNTGVRRDFYDAQVIPHGSGKTVAPLGMVFTKDGSRLLAWGEDQFVSNWSVNNGVIDSDLKNTKHHRWQFYRESFGIVASGVLTKDNRYLLVAGNAVNKNEVAFHNLNDNSSYWIYQENTKDTKRHFYSTMAFNEKDHQIILGREDGGVEIRGLDVQNKKYASQTILNLEELKPEHPNVTLVSLNQDQSKLFVFWVDGNWAFWNIENGKYAKGLTSNTLVMPKGTINKFADISADFKWLAYSAYSEKQKVAMAVDFKTEKHHIAQKPEAELGIRLEPFQVQFDQSYNLYVNYGKFKESTNEVLGSILAKYENSNSGFKLEKQFKVDYQIQSFCIHPDQKHLAITGGMKNEVSILNFAEAPKVVSSLALKLYNFSEIQVSEEGKQLALRISQNQDKWLTFDMEKKFLLKKAPEQNWAKPILNKNGWTFKIDPYDKYSVVLENGGLTIPIKLDADDGWIKCASFLPGKGLKIVLGHKYGATLYEVNSVNKKAVVIKALRGHKKYVVALTPSANGDILYTCGDDFSVAAFSLKDLPLHPNLGISVVMEKNELIVDKVYPYSPGWLVGLKTRSNQNIDKITKIIEYDERNEELSYELGKKISPEDFKKKWDTPPVGKIRKIFFDSYLKGMDGKLSPTEKGEQTRCLVRPTWKLMIDESLEWVLYRWQDMYYDSSPLGDRIVGWVVCQRKEGNYPIYSVADQFIKIFKKPEMTTLKILSSLLLYEEKSQTKNGYPHLSSPKVELKVDAIEGGIDCKIQIKEDPDARELGKLERVLVYRDDYLIYQANALPGKDFKIPDSIKIPISKLRTGKNEIRVITETRSGVRAEKEVIYNLEKPPADRPKPKMHSMSAGVSDYAVTSVFRDLSSARDCQLFDKLIALKTEATNIYTKGNSVLLINTEVTPENLLQSFSKLEKSIDNPDDLLIVLLSGHGVSGKSLAEVRKKNELNPGDLLTKEAKYFFVCANFNLAAYEETSLDADELIGGLESIPCRKIVLLDACHAGRGGEWYGDFRKHVNPVLLIGAAGKDEEAMERSIRDKARLQEPEDGAEINNMNGFFTYFFARELFGSNAHLAFGDKDILNLTDVFKNFEINFNKFKEANVQFDNTKPVLQSPLMFRNDKAENIILRKK